MLLANSIATWQGLSHLDPDEVEKAAAILAEAETQATARQVLVDAGMRPELSTGNYLEGMSTDEIAHVLCMIELSATTAYPEPIRLKLTSLGFYNASEYRRSRGKQWLSDNAHWLELIGNLDSPARKLAALLPYIDKCTLTVDDIEEVHTHSLSHSKADHKRWLDHNAETLDYAVNTQTITEYRAAMAQLSEPPAPIYAPPPEPELADACESEPGLVTPRQEPDPTNRVIVFPGFSLQR